VITASAVAAEVVDRSPPRLRTAADHRATPLVARPHRRPGGALQGVVDPGMLPAVVGAGIGLDLDPEKDDGATLSAR
jgi:hypothetical protein